MTRENVEALRALYEEWGRGNFAAGLDLFDPYVLVMAPPDDPDAGRYLGLERYADYIRGILADWEHLTLTAEEIIEAGDSVVVATVQRGTGRGSGVSADRRYFEVWTFRGSVVIRREWFRDRVAALEACGSAQAMSPESVERAREVMDVLGQPDAERVIALADPDVEWHSFFALGEGGVYRGHDGTRHYVRDLTDAWESVSAEVEHQLGVGDVAVLVGRIHYRGRDSGVESTSPAGWMLKFRDGKLVRFRAFRDPEKALEALGLRG